MQPLLFLQHVTKQTTPPTWVCDGGGGMGSDVIIRTAALLSVEYHHSISFRANTLMGSVLFTTLFHKLSTESGELCGNIAVK